MLFGFCFFPLSFLSHSPVNLPTPLLGLIQLLCVEFILVLSLSLWLFSYFCLSVVSSARFGVYVVESVLLAPSWPSISLCRSSVSNSACRLYVRQSNISPRTFLSTSSAICPWILPSTFCLASDSCFAYSSAWFLLVFPRLISLLPHSLLPSLSILSLYLRPGMLSVFDQPCFLHPSPSFRGLSSTLVKF
jgi:hypothetical protein